MKGQLGITGILALFPTAIDSGNKTVEDSYSAAITQSVVDAIAVGLRESRYTWSAPTTGDLWTFITQSEASGDAITITKAEWRASRQELRVEATSSEQPGAVLTLVGFGEMTFKKGKYTFKKKPTANPGTVTVTSSLGGGATKTVKVK